MKIDSLLSALNDLSEKESVTEDDIAKAIQDSADKVYHTIFRSGFSESENRADKKLTAARGEIEELSSNLAKNASMIEEYKKGDSSENATAALTEKYENALRAKDEGIAELQATLESKENEYTNTIRGRELSSFRNRVRAKLVSDGADPDLAEAKVQLFNLDRVELGDDLTVSRILQTDGATPYPNSPETKPFEYIAREIWDTIPERLKEDRRQQGSRLGSGGGQSAPRYSERDVSRMSDAEYEKNREAIFRANSEGRVL